MLIGRIIKSVCYKTHENISVDYFCLFYSAHLEYIENSPYGHLCRFVLSVLLVAWVRAMEMLCQCLEIVLMQSIFSEVLSYSFKKEKSNLLCARDIATKRVTNGGAYLPGL